MWFGPLGAIETGRNNQAALPAVFLAPRFRLLADQHWPSCEPKRSDKALPRYSRFNPLRLRVLVSQRPVFMHALNQPWHAPGSRPAFFMLPKQIDLAPEHDDAWFVHFASAADGSIAMDNKNGAPTASGTGVYPMCPALASAVPPRLIVYAWGSSSADRISAYLNAVDQKPEYIR